MTPPRSSANPAVAPVFVVDDDAVARELVVRSLRQVLLRNPIVPAGDLREARELIDESPLPPALVLLDVHLPDGSGLDLLRWLRSKRPLERTPVFMLSATDELEDIDRAYELGASSYLVKPVGFAAIQDVLEQMALPWVLLPPE